MDPALWELWEAGDRHEQVAAIIRLGEGASLPAGVRLVAQFGEIATCRLERDAIPDIHADAAVMSLKASRWLWPEPIVEAAAPEAQEVVNWLDERRPADLAVTGRGVVIGIVDWGFDVAHPDLCNADGSTRILALWDQRSHSNKAPQPYGYGHVHTTEAINHALQTADPYETLNYHPADSDDGQGAHGTHVASIAAGNGRSGGPLGLAPEADLVCVQLSSLRPVRQDKLGDSVSLLEAVDFIARTAGNRPWVINLSMGRHGEQHDGSTLVEQGLDAAVMAAPGRAIVQSCGNYYNRQIHTAGQVHPGETRQFVWAVDEADVTPNELEIWYSGRDVFDVEIQAPNGALRQRVGLRDRAPLVVEGRRVGNLYHRANEPNTHDNHIDVFLYPEAPAGEWTLTLIGKDVVDGRFHAWIERDAAIPRSQSQFSEEDAIASSTTGTICNGFRTIAVGAYNPHSPGQEIAAFSSAGPTRDGRYSVPALVAPGVSILAARSASWDGDSPLLVRKSGTSMATPHVTGTVALMFEAAPYPLPIETTRSLLLSSTRKVEVSEADRLRLGSGYLDPERAVLAAKNHPLPLTHPEEHSIDQEVAMHPDETMQSPTPPTFNLDRHSSDVEQHLVNELESVPHDLAQLKADDLSEATIRNLILVSGGPGLFDNRDVEHDKSWANYVTPPLLLTDTAEKRKQFVAADEEVWWFVYQPAYVRRWEDDLKQKRTATKRVKDQGFASYVDLIAGRAKQRGWKLRWFDSADEFWSKLQTFNDPISRLLYWGHASGGLWLTLAHSDSAVAVAPDVHEIITVDSITANAALKKRFQAGAASRVHRFVGCNTDGFAQAWAKAYGVWAEGFAGKVDFGDIHSTGGEPSLVDTARRLRFSSDGKAAAEQDEWEWIVEMDDKPLSNEPSMEPEKPVQPIPIVAPEPVMVGATQSMSNWDSVWETELAINGSIASAFNSVDHDDTDSDIDRDTDDESNLLNDGYSPIWTDEWEETCGQLVELADAAVVTATDVRSPAMLLHPVLADSDWADHLKALGPQQMLTPATMFEALKPDGSPALKRQLEPLFEVVVAPGETIPPTLQRGDILVRLGEGNFAHLAMLATGELVEAKALALAGLAAESQRDGFYAQVIELGPFPKRSSDQFARRLADSTGRSYQQQMVVRLKPDAIAHLRPPGYLRECAVAEVDNLGVGETVGHQCRAGEGPPAAVPDPEGRGLHPLIYKGTTQQRSRNPSVGDAQQLLNRFLQQVQRSMSGCSVQTAAVQQFMAQGLARLRQNGQLPLTVDCRFGPSTELATKVFQACRGLERDGKIGPNTWAELVRLRPTPPVQPVQPVRSVRPAIAPLDPPRWAPILRSRLSSAAALRSGNAVTHLIDGPATFRAMVAAIRSAQTSSHYIYLLGWILKDDFELIPGDPSSTFRRLLSTAASRGVQIRVMLWDQVGTQNSAEVRRINGLATGAAILDNETPNPISGFGSHHQKVLIVKGSEGLVTFCGGIDINDDRIRATGGSGSSGSSGGNGSPLHDVHCRILGPAAFDLLQTFIRRWDHHPDQGRIDRARGALLGRSEPLPAPISAVSTGISSTGRSSSVCIARTFNPVTAGSRVPRERDIRTLLIEAIRQARRFIYMEDQYLIHPVAAAELRAAVPRLEHLTILITASELSDLPCVWKFRNDFITSLTRGLSARDRAKVRIFFLATPPLSTPPTLGRHTYVHAKTWVFDDELAVIGSANCNRRGWDHDSEVNAFIFDDHAGSGAGLTFAQHLRSRLWAEHLNVAPTAVVDGVASAGLWLSPPAGARIMPYNPTAGRDRIPAAVCDRTIGTIDPTP